MSTASLGGGAWVAAHPEATHALLDHLGIIGSTVAAAFGSSDTVVVNPASVSFGVSDSSSAAGDGSEEQAVSTPPSVPQTTPAAVVAVPARSTAAPRPAAPAVSPPPPAPVVPPPTPPPAPVHFFSFTPTIGSQGGGGGGVNNPTTPPNSASVPTPTPVSVPTPTPTPTPIPDTTAPNAPIISSPSDGSILTTTSISFSGTAEAGSTLSTNFSSTTAAVSGGGLWSLPFILAQGTTTILFYATDAAGNRSASATTTVFVDSVAPDAAISFVECADSLSSDACVLATTALSPSWSSSASDIAYFVLNQNGVVSTTTTLASAVTATNHLLYSASVSAVDHTGNRSATSTASAFIETRPVVVNEVAWAGTAASASDEWLELYNNTPYALSLANWTLFASDLTPYIPLSGTIAASGYYLIEKTEPVTNVAADLTANFGSINNNGESFSLARKPMGAATTTLDTVAICIGGGTQWCAGSASDFTTLERYDPLASGADSNNWGSNLGEFILNGLDRTGNPLVGTPKARNSINYLISLSSTLSMDKTLSASSSPYLVGRSGLTVGGGVTLTVSAGVVIKTVSPNSPTIFINGILSTLGSTSSPVVFTSFSDDANGGDTNGDGGATSPAAGNWRQLRFMSGSTGSSLSYTNVFYGGNAHSLAPQGAVGVESAAVSFSHVLVATSSTSGIALSSSDSTISHSVFSGNNQSSASASGVVASGGTPSISQNAFLGNYIGVSLSSSPATLASNSFINQGAEAVSVTGVLGSFTGNSASGNTQNAIVFGNGSTVTVSGATTTLIANNLPYLVKRKATVASNSVLAFGQGVVVKGHDNRSSNAGEIEVQSGASLYNAGTAPSDLVFTSLRDTSVGGTTESGLASAAAGDWVGITVLADGHLALSGFTLKYGGQRATNPFYGESAGALKITGGTAASGNLMHALFDTNYQSGLNLASVLSLAVSDVVFQNHTTGGAGYGTAIYGNSSAASFATTTFSNNQYDGVGSGNTFTCINCGTPVTSPAHLLDH